MWNGSSPGAFLQVHWPVNLIVTENSMKTYQLIFRHLFELKCVERELSKVWKIFQRARPIPRQALHTLTPDNSTWLSDSIIILQTAFASQILRCKGSRDEHWQMWVCTCRLQWAVSHALHCWVYWLIRARLIGGISERGSFSASRSHSEGGLKRAYGLCQRMMHFFHQYLLYVTFEVLEPHWLTLLSQLNAADTLDKVPAILLFHLDDRIYKCKSVRSLCLICSSLFLLRNASNTKIQLKLCIHLLEQHIRFYLGEKNIV